MDDRFRSEGEGPVVLQGYSRESWFCGATSGQDVVVVNLRRIRSSAFMRTAIVLRLNGNAKAPQRTGIVRESSVRIQRCLEKISCDVDVGRLPKILKNLDKNHERGWASLWR